MLAYGKSLVLAAGGAGVASAKTRPVTSLLIGANLMHLVGDAGKELVLKLRGGARMPPRAATEVAP